MERGHKCTNRSQRIMSIILGVLITSLALVSCQTKSPERLTDQQVTALREAYPVQGGIPPTVDMMEPDFEAMLKDTSNFNLIEILGPAEDLEVPADENDPVVAAISEKGAPLQHRYRSNKARVIRAAQDDLKDGQVITVSVNRLFEDVTPTLKEGDRVVMPLTASEFEKIGYKYAVYSMYYVTKDNYVLSAFDEQASSLAKSGLKVDQALIELNKR